MQTAVRIEHDAGGESRTQSARYARCVKISKRVRWDVDRDVIRGRDFDFSRTFLPASLSKVGELEFLTGSERRLLSQVQGRTYAYLFGLGERFIGTKVLELSGRHWQRDEVAHEALARFSDEELKHQELFRRLDALMNERMAPGHRKTADPDETARTVLGHCAWAVLAFSCHIELFVQQHYEESFASAADLCPLWRDVFKYHWREECQHAVLDELEWTAEHARLDADEIDAAVDQFIALLRGTDRLLEQQAAADTAYFVGICGSRFAPAEAARIGATVLAAYRWQYIGCGMRQPRFTGLLGSMTTPAQRQRIAAALSPTLGG